MFIHGRMFETGNTGDIAIEVQVQHEDEFNQEVMDALKNTGRSYCPEVTWDNTLHCYIVKAHWDVDPDWGDDFIAIQNRLRRVIPIELISVRWERPNELVWEERALIDVELP